MKIAVCGDDRNTREQIASLIREQEPDAEIVTFEAGETMIKSQENFAVSFLDVEMKEHTLRLSFWQVKMGRNFSF